TVLSTAALAFPAAQASDATPHRDALEDGVSIGLGADSRIDFVGDDLHVREDGATVMVITAERELYLKGAHMPLDASGRVLVDRYYITVENFIDDALDVAGDAAGLGLSAAFEVLAAVFHGEEEVARAEQRIEDRAREIEQQADRMCEQLRGIESIEREMQAAIPGFEPVMFAATDSI